MWKVLRIDLGFFRTVGVKMDKIQATSYRIMGSYKESYMYIYNMYTYASSPQEGFNWLARFVSLNRFFGEGIHKKIGDPKWDPEFAKATPGVDQASKPGWNHHLGIRGPLSTPTNIIHTFWAIFVELKGAHIRNHQPWKNDSKLQSVWLLLLPHCPRCISRNRQKSPCGAGLPPPENPGSWNPPWSFVKHRKGEQKDWVQTIFVYSKLVGIIGLGNWLFQSDSNL